jgi:hypothetical protein
MPSVSWLDGGRETTSFGGGATASVDGEWALIDSLTSVGGVILFVGFYSLFHCYLAFSV